MNQAAMMKLQQAWQEFQSGRADQAKATLQRAIQQYPSSPELSSAMALVLMHTGPAEQALYFAERAAQARPQEPSFLVNYGNALAHVGRVDESDAVFSRAAALAPQLAEAHLGLANNRWQQRRYLAASVHAARAYELRPGDATLAATYATMLNFCGRADRAVEVGRRAAATSDDPVLSAIYAHALNYVADPDPREILRAHEAYGRLLSAKHPERAAIRTNTRDPGRRIRLGVLSHEFRQHAVASFLEPWLAHVDPAGIELFCYSTSPVNDGVSERFRGYAAHWRDIARLTPAQAYDAIAADMIDVLVDTSGLTQGHRTPLLCMRAAPVQVTYLGYPATTGLRTIDFRLVDPITDPPGAEAFSTERLVRMEPGFWCYRPPGDAPELAPPPSETTGFITFGSFNSLPKLNDGIIALWSRVLQAVAGSRLVLKALELNEPELRADVISRFAAAGAPADRIEVLGPTASIREHLASYSRVDVALDPFPYNGTTTTFEALYMGVPVVTLEGRLHAGRATTSILRTVGRSEWVCQDQESYIAVASGLAQGARQRRELRTEGPRSLRHQLLSSPLCDEPAYARRMDATIRTLWRNWCEANGSTR